MGNFLFSENIIMARALWAAVIIIAGLAAYWLINRLILMRAQKNDLVNSPSLTGVRPGIPAILYFTSPDCVPCRTVQRPALKKLQDHLGDQFQVIEVNTHENPELANLCGVLSVPTTFIISPKGKLLFVNHGATRAEKLLEQMQHLPQ